MRFPCVTWGLALLSACSPSTGPRSEPTGARSGPTGSPASAPDVTVEDIATDMTVTVEGSSTRHMVKPLQGFLISWPGALTPTGRDRLRALKPSAWRGGHGSGLSEVTALFPDIRTVFVLSDPFLDMHGGGIEVGCNPSSSPRCFADFASLKTAWRAYVEAVAQGSSAPGPTWWDLMNEPDGFWHGLMGTELAELLQVAHDAIRARFPAARLVAPSISAYEGAGIGRFFEWSAARNLRFDAVSWHELVRLDGLEANVADVRKRIAQAYATQPSLAPKEVHVNEWIGGQSHLIPGWTLGYVAAMERAGVDLAVRACWYPNEAKKPDESECGAGLNGLFLPDGETPRAIYWVHRAWAELGDARLTTRSTNAELVAVASPTDGNETSVLIGRFTCGVTETWCTWRDAPSAEQAKPPRSVRVEVVLPTPAAALRTVRMHRYAFTAEGRAVQEADVPQTQLAVPVRDGRAVFTINAFADGDVYRVSL